MDVSSNRNVLTVLTSPQQTIFAPMIHPQIVSKAKLCDHLTRTKTKKQLKLNISIDIIVQVVPFNVNSQKN